VLLPSNQEKPAQVVVVVVHEAEVVAEAVQAVAKQPAEQHDKTPSRHHTATV